MGVVYVVDIEEISNPDIVRNKDALSLPHMRAYTHSLVEKGKTFEFQIFQNTEKADGPTVFVLHDNENVAFDAAVRVLSEYGGKVIALENSEMRYIGRTDPNKIFGANYPQYTAFIEGMISEGSPVIAFHTNRNGHGGKRGTVSIERYPDARERTNSAISSFRNGGDADDLIWVAAPKAVEDTPWARSFIDKMSSSNINVVYEIVAGRSDGSLSNWAAENGHKYINVEGEHGAIDRINYMVDAAFSALGIDKIPSQAGCHINFDIAAPSVGQ